MQGLNQDEADLPAGKPTTVSSTIERIETDNDAGAECAIRFRARRIEFDPVNIVTVKGHAARQPQPTPNRTNFTLQPCVNHPPPTKTLKG